MLRASLPLALLLAGACSFSSKLTGPGFGSTSSTPAAAPSSTSDTIVVPDLLGLTLEQANARLRAAGGREVELSSQNNACDLDRRPSYDQGQVCYQRPVPGATASPRVPVSVNLQRDTPTHGNIGFGGEWQSMPDLVGKTIAQARPITAKASLPFDEHFELLEADCPDGTICATSPAAGERKVLARKARLYLGKAKPVPPTPSTTTPPTPTQPTEPAGGYF